MNNMKQTNFENIVEIIDQAVAELLPVEDSMHNETRESINKLLECAKVGYVLVEWPSSQEFMEEDWFENEAILALGNEDVTGSSAYFIPIARII
jgi:hypothetical protein